MSVGATGPVAEPILERGRRRYRWLPPAELEQLARAAAARVAGGVARRDSDPVLAAHVAFAVLVGERLAPAGGRDVWPDRASTGGPASRSSVAGGTPSEIALAEHLEARLPPEESLAVALRATCTVRRAARVLKLTSAEG